MSLKTITRVLLFVWLLALSTPAVCCYFLEDFSVIVSINSAEEENGENDSFNFSEEKQVLAKTLNFPFLQHELEPSGFTCRLEIVQSIPLEIFSPPPEV